MNKYWIVAKNTWDEVLTYRLSFAMYRVRSVLTFLTIYYLWFALIPAKGSVFGYTQAIILTYILGTALMNAFVLSSRSYSIGDDIIQGNLSNYLIKPLNYFLYWVAKDIGDKAMNISFAFVELSVIFFFLRPPFVIQTDLVYISFFLIAIFIAMTLYFMFNLILGMIGFWSNEIWAPRFIFMILLSFFAGGYFPLDVLPKSVLFFFKFLPFEYLIYLPLQIYLKRLSLADSTISLMGGVLWIVILYCFVSWLWKKGLQEYTAQGR